MKIVVAIDKFKGCANGIDLAHCIERTIKSVMPQATVNCVPVADGGDGTAQALAMLIGDNNINRYSVKVKAPLSQLPLVEAQYFIETATATAYMDLASASGLALVPHHLRDVMSASTFGTGMMILDAIGHGARHVVLGLGGSATCDAATGLLQALGFDFLDAHGRSLNACGAALEKVVHVNSHNVGNDIKNTKFTILTDVNNPLLGHNGCAAVFAPQKGASPLQVQQLERGLSNFSRFMPASVATTSGAGAAGGVAAGMIAFLDASIRQGIDYVLELANFHNLIDGAQLVITGEGRIDDQTSMGKAPWGVLNAAKKQGVPVVAMCGSLAPDTNLDAMGFDQVIAITPPSTPLHVAMNPATTFNNLSKAITTLLQSLSC